MLIKKSNIQTRLKLTLLALFLLASVGLQAQILVTQPMTGTPAAGSYYNPSSITVMSDFSFTPGPGQSLTLSIITDCTPLTNNLSMGQNYILTTVPRIPAFNPATSGYGTCDIMQTVQYIDGLGRPLQTVQIKGSATGNDLVQPFAYDQFGREATKYLPYAMLPTTVSDGSYKANALTAGAGQGHFYSSPPTGVSTIATPQAGTAFEPSPLNRVVEQGAPGNDWQLGNHTNKIIYTANGTNIYPAALYSVNIDANGNRTLVYGGSYNAGQLYVTVSQNENWNTGQSDNRLNTTEEYKDKEEHIVLKRAYNYSGGAVQTLSTYYVYDDLGNLTYVLPPASGADGSSGITSANNQTTLNNLCYQYGYDNRNRMITKQLPGKGLEEMVYNLLDQVIFTRDAAQAGRGEWGFVKYDALGRVIMTGIEKSNTATRSVLQSYVTSVFNNPTAVSPPITEWETPLPGGGVQGYTNTAFPGSANVVPLVVHYYDDYSFQGQPSTVAPPAGASTMTKGLLTATKTGVLNTMYNSTPDLLWTVHYYDDLGRITQTYAQHYLSGALSSYNYDVVTNTYDFTNEVTATNRTHYNSSNTTTPAVTIANTYLYDHMGRKKQTLESINGAPNVLLSQADYNEIGQVMTKHLHSSNSGSSFLQNIAYTYNERGWLTASSAPLFATQLEYNSNPANISGVTAQYNGNIASQVYTSYAQPTKNYVYGYDYLNRLTSGISSDGFNESGITYDLMGNIATLNRYQAGTVIDNLVYTYSGNRVQGVNDLSTDNSPYGYRPGNYTAYNYDVNGNMTVMPTPPDGSTPVANINIQYNQLNLPQTITGGRTITYTYDAAGTKLRKVSSNNVSTDCISGIQYDQSVGATAPTISFIQTEEGKAVPLSAGGYDYYYYLSDNLGNTRVTFDTKMGSATVLQQDDYYPFGYEISRGTITSPKNEYLYNKKELQEELQQYDYGARFYDPVIGRWTTVDPLVEEDQESTTPYGYVFNDPIRFVDPDGRVPEDGPGPAVKILVGGLAISGGMVAVAAPTVVGEVIALPAAAVTATGTLLVAGWVAIWSTLFHHNTSVEPSPSPLLKTEDKTNNRDGKDFTPKGKKTVIDDNKAKNNGQTVCENCGVKTTKPGQSKKGQTPPGTDTQVDHKKAKSKGGSGTPDNGQVLYRDCNIKKGDKDPTPPQPHP